MHQHTELSVAWEQRPAVVAGLLLHALHHMTELGLESLSIHGILHRLGVSRSQAYEWADRHRAWSTGLPGAGRPKKGPVATSQPEEQVKVVGFQVRDWLMRHPGAVCPGPKRMIYSDPFRAFVLSLASPGSSAAGLSHAQLAEACGVPLHTLVGWLGAGRLPQANAPIDSPVASAEAKHPQVAASGDVPSAISEETAPNVATLPTSQWAAGAAQVLELWSVWRGPFGPFCDSLAGHGIHMSRALVRNILHVSGRRLSKRRRGANPDAEAIRGELVRLFPNAQWNADGKDVHVRVGDRLYRFNLELVVDTATAAHLGFSLRDREDSRGLLAAYGQAAASAKGTPLGFLRDAKPCNHSEAVEAQLNEDGVISMVSTVGRPQNNSPVENSFSLLEWKLPIPILPPLETLTPAELGRLVMAYMLLGVCVGRNHTPRSRLKNRSPAQAFDQCKSTEEQKLEAQEILRQLRRKVQARAEADRLRCHPVTLTVVRQAFKDLGLSDPKDLLAPAAAHYGLEACLEAIAAFQAKREAQTLPEDNHERYFIGIARNVAFRNEDLRVYEGLLALRAKSGQLILAPLKEHDGRLRQTLSSTDYLVEVSQLAVTSKAPVDRTYWRHRALQALSGMPDALRQDLGRSCARSVAVTHSIPHRERDAFVAELAKVVVPLAA